MATMSVPSSLPLFTDTLADAARRNLDVTLAACDRFRQWHRENFLLKEPTPEQVRDHASAVRWLLRLNRALLTVVADPKSPGHDLKARVEVMIRLLEECWQSVHEPMPEVEADAILARTFPE